MEIGGIEGGHFVSYEPFIMLCIYLTPPTWTVLFACPLSGWITTAGLVGSPQ